MCVILICDRSRPTPEMVKASWAANDHGGGAAWLDFEGSGKSRRRVVRWEKGLSEDEMADRCATLPIPFIAHFRIASQGGRSMDLTHPFPLEPSVSLRWEGGSCAEGVLFHNGNWSDWKKTMLDAAVRFGKRLPSGVWSDSRALAFLATTIGEGFLEFIEGQRICVFTPQPDGFGGDYTLNLYGWWPTRIPGDEAEGGGILPSNESWKPRGKGNYYTTPPASMAGGGKGPGGNPTVAPFRSNQAGEGQTQTPAASVTGPRLLPSGTSLAPALQASGVLPSRLGKAGSKLRRRVEKAAAAEQRKLDAALRKGTLPSSILH